MIVTIFIAIIIIIVIITIITVLTLTIINHNFLVTKLEEAMLLLSHFSLFPNYITWTPAYNSELS